MTEEVKLKADYGINEAAMQAYQQSGEQRALALNNRGPIRFTADGELHPEIVQAYSEFGFYVFQSVIEPAELADLDADFQQILTRFPVTEGAAVDASGRPAIGADSESITLFWSKPLADPFGGTDLANGRHPVKMNEPVPSDDAPDQIVYLVQAPLRFSDAALRAYGHPQLLAVAAAINGPDFTPFTEALFIKEPGRGASVAWHRDGITHWDKPEWDENTHGFNFMIQLYGCTPANGVWVIPGSHRLNKVNIPERVARAGSERLPEAVPLVCDAGDVVMCNRQTVHGSFANTSDQWRVTFNQGFHRRSSVLGVTAGGLHNKSACYDQSRIEKRSRLLGYAIDARRQRFPAEKPFAYRPFEQDRKSYIWNDEAREDIRDYNLLDLSI